MSVCVHARVYMYMFLPCVIILGLLLSRKKKNGAFLSSPIGEYKFFQAAGGSWHRACPQTVASVPVFCVS